MDTLTPDTCRQRSCQHHSHEHRLGRVRVRWAAIGAAVAVALGGGGLAWVRAATPPAGNDYVPVEPCRLIDTRFDIGPITATLGPGSTSSAVLTGATVGQCSNVPTAATSLNVNITAVNASANTFLTVFPAGSAMPLASSLNPRAGSITGNEVNITLPANDRVSFFNNVGTMELVVDLLGYYIPASPGPLDALPSGQTVTGYEVIDEYPVNDQYVYEEYFPLPIRPTVPLSNSNVNFAPVATANVVSDGDSTCTGTAEAPTAPPGKLCIYIFSSEQLKLLEGRASILNAAAPIAGSSGFTIVALGDATVGKAIVRFSYAYTAP